MEEESRRRYQGGGIVEEDPWRRNNGGGIMEEEGGRANQESGIKEKESWRSLLGRNRGGASGKTLGASWKHPGSWDGHRETCRKLGLPLEAQGHVLKRVTNLKRNAK